MVDLPVLLYILLVAPMAVAWWAQSKVRETYLRESRVQTQRGHTGLEAARQLLEEENLNEVEVEVISGKLNDHYDPLKKVLRLSSDTARNDTLTSIGIVGHEVAHAAQDIRGYGLMRVRNTLGQWLLALTRISLFVFIGGFLLGSTLLMIAAIVIVGLQALFSLVALPVERNASERALEMLEHRQLIVDEERSRIQRVLRVASYTYMALVGQRIAVFLFWVIVVGALTEAWRMM